MAVKGPAVAGLVENVTVMEVEVTAVMSPTAPLFRVTLLSATTVSNPKPLITRVVPLAARLVVLAVTTGVTVATWTAAPLLWEFVVMTALRSPAMAGSVVSEIVSDVGVAAVIVPTALLSRTTVLLATTGSKPNPEMVSVAVVAAPADDPLEPCSGFHGFFVCPLNH